MSLETRPSSGIALISFISVCSVLFFLNSIADIDYMFYLLAEILSSGLFYGLTISLLIVWSYGMKGINHLYSVKYLSKDRYNMMRSKEIKADHLIGLIFLYNMDFPTIRKAFTSFLHEQELYGVDATLFISGSSDYKISKEYIFLSDLVAEHNQYACTSIDIRVTDQKDGKGKRVGGMAPSLKLIREDLFELYERIYGDKFDREKANSLNSFEQLRAFIKENDFRCMLWMVDGDTVIPKNKDTFLKISSLLFDKKNDCAAVTTDNLAICPNGNLIYNLHTRFVRFLGRHGNLSSLPETTVITGRSASFNASILFYNQFIEMVERDGSYIYGRWVQWLNADDKSSRSFIHRLGMKALYASHIYVYSIEEQPFKGTWQDYTQPGIWKIIGRTSKNTFRSASRELKSGVKMPFLLRLRYFDQRWLFFRAVLGPQIVFFGALEYGYEIIILYLNLVFVTRGVEMLIWTLTRYKHYQLSWSDKLNDFLVFPLAVYLKWFITYISGYIKCFTVMTQDKQTWDRSTSESNMLGRLEFMYRRFVSYSMVGFLAFSTVIYVGGAA